MNYYRCLASILVIAALLLIPGNFTSAQEAKSANHQSEPDVEIFNRVEQELHQLSEKNKQDIESARRVEVQLWDFLKLYPNSIKREQAEEALIQAQEILAGRCLELAYSHFARGKLTTLDMQGAEFWFVKTIYESPKFSRRDEALLALAKLYLSWGRRDDAIKHLQKLVCNYPDSKYAGEALEQLKKIGVGRSEDCGKLIPE